MGMQSKVVIEAHTLYYYLNESIATKIEEMIHKHSVNLFRALSHNTHKSISFRRENFVQYNLQQIQKKVSKVTKKE